MALTQKDIARLRSMFRAEVRSLLDDLIQGHDEAMGGYDGATEVKDDDWAEDGKRRIGFEPPTTGGIQKTVK